MAYPNERARLSARRVPSCPGRAGAADHYALLRKIAPCLGGFRFRLPGAVVAGQYEGEEVSAAQLAVARRRIDSSVCLFGGSLPPRSVSFDDGERSGSKKPTSVVSASAAEQRERAKEEAERKTYEEGLPSRYLMKDGCISWEVEVHEVIPSKPGIKKGASAAKKPAAAKQASGGVPPPLATSVTLATPKPGKAKRPAPIDTSREVMASGQICAPVTPHTPGSLMGGPNAPSSPPGISASSTGGTASTSRTPVRGKGVKSKYRCKLCGLPKQNHNCPYKNSLERSIGTMAYPAVNAFVSHEPGRLAPALCAMNNFTDLLPSGQGGVGPSASMTSQGQACSPGGRHPPHNYGIRAPVTPHWHPNTPGGLSTMSSSDHGSPPSSHARGHAAPGTPPSCHGKRHAPGGGSPGSPHGKRIKASPSSATSSSSDGAAGADGEHRLPADALFRDMTHLQAEQYRAVGGVATAAGREQQALQRLKRGGGGKGAPMAAQSRPVQGASDPGRGDYRYPAVPTPYALRKEMGDALFALSREVPGLADGCASVLRTARADDSWDQAVAELTTQVLVVLGCDDCDVTLEGLRGQLVQLGVAC